MSTWILRWNFNKTAYSPGGAAVINIWLENTGQNDIYLSDLEMQFEFGDYRLEKIVGKISPRENKLLGMVNIQLPQAHVGRKIFSFQYQIYEFTDKGWISLGYYLSDKRYFISIYPAPLFNVFISRGIGIEDRTVGDPITEMIKEWGFKTTTVGIEVQSSTELVPINVREEIKKADALVAIATPRYLDSITELWKTLEWLHAEVGIAFGLHKPLIIIRDKTVSLSGLPSYLASSAHAPVLVYDQNNLDNIRSELSTLMPGFREWIETKRDQEFNDNISRILISGMAVVGGITIASGIIGYLSDSSKK